MDGDDIEVEDLSERPDLVVGLQGGDEILLELRLNFPEGFALHQTNSGIERSTEGRGHEDLIKGGFTQDTDSV